jgi:hypothetical protein
LPAQVVVTFSVHFFVLLDDMHPRPHGISFARQ